MVAVSSPLWTGAYPTLALIDSARGVYVVFEVAFHRVGALEVVEIIGSGSRQCRAFRTSNQWIIPQIRIARFFHLWVLRHDRHSPPAFA
jgi:hypothetical protein